MPRLSTISIDSQGLAPPQWSGSWVQRRLIEAYSVERRLPRSRRRTIASSWPGMVVEFVDLIGRADVAREQVFQSWEYSGVGVSAADLSRMEQAHDWLREILASYPEERLCLMQWATAIAYRRSLRRLLLQRRWSRSTFYRMVGAGAHVIAVELQRRKLPVV
jgi:hypothetical protein